MTRLLCRRTNDDAIRWSRRAGTRDQAISRSVGRFMGSGPSAITVVPSTGLRGGELGAHEVDPGLTPEQLTVDDEGRHGEHALLVRLCLMLGEQGRPRARREGIEARKIDADLLQE